MLNAQAFFYLAGVLLLLIAGFGPRTGRISLALFGGAALAFGWTLPAIAHLFGH